MKNMIDSNRLKPITITIWSETFKTGDTIPIEYTCDSNNIPPSLFWTEIPSNAKSIAIIMEDPDAPRGTFTHWTIYNIPPHIRGLHVFIPKIPDLGVWPLGGNGFQGIVMAEIIPSARGDGEGVTVHNLLLGRDIVATHPSESVGVLSPYSMFPQDVGKNWQDLGAI